MNTGPEPELHSIPVGEEQTVVDDQCLDQDLTSLCVGSPGHGDQRPAGLRLHGLPAHGDDDHGHGAAVHPGGPGRRGAAHQAGTQGEETPPGFRAQRTLTS